MIKLVLTDLDATLFSVKDGSVATPETMAAIDALLDAGVHFGPVTGRTPISMSQAFPGDPRCYATGAFANGQIVYLDGEIVHREWVDAEPLQRVAEFLDEVGMGTLILFDMEGDKGAWYVTTDPKRVSASEDFGSYISRIEPRVEASVLKTNIRFEAPRSEIDRLRDQLRAEFPEFDFVYPGLNVPLIDILPKGYGKGGAVKVLARELSLTLDEVATFGDSENDLSMLAAVPNSVAVANATPEVAAAARWHIGSADDHAMVDALHDIARSTQAQEMPSFMR